MNVPASQKSNRAQDYMIEITQPCFLLVTTHAKPAAFNFERRKRNTREH